MPQQTAVEWLVKEFSLENFTATIEFAKQKEKEQMIDFYNWMRSNDSAEEYFHYSDGDMLTDYLNQNK